MNRNRTFLISLAVGLAFVAGIVALGRTLALGQQARTANERQIAQRTAQLDRYEASLQRALDQKTPALPPLPTRAAATTAPGTPVRVVYHRPPPVVVVTHQGESEHGEDDHGEHEVAGASEDD